MRQSGDAIVRLEDVATVTLGSENYDFNVAFGGKRSVFIGIKVAPEANILDVAKRVRQAFPEIRAQLPTGLSAEVVYDSTDFINTSISEVVKTLAEALLIVTVVIFLFLGSFRAVFVPVIAMPLSLVGTFFVMLLLGYSINLLTLLALVLAIGLVVDDAIIVVENVDRHMKEGMSPFDAALTAARELGGPILAMTVVLIAVYVPIGFQGGLTGALFTEFAFTLAGAVAVSGIVALTLSPMMCSRFFKAQQDHSRLVRAIDRVFETVRSAYRRTLHGVLDTYPVLIVMACLLIGMLAVMFELSQSELAPQEDEGLVMSQVVGPPTATAAQMQVYADQVFKGRELDARVRPDVPDHRRADAQFRHRRRHPQALGPALAQRQGGAGRAAGALEQDRRRPRRRVPVAAAAGRLGPAGAVRHHHHRLVRQAERGRPAGDGKGARRRQVLFRRRRPEDRQATGLARRRPRQDRRARHDAGRRRQRARCGDGRRLRQLLLDRRALVQGHSAGAADRSAQPRGSARPADQDPGRRTDPGEHGRARRVPGRAAVDHPASSSSTR